MQAVYLASSVFKECYAPCFGLFTRIQKLIMLAIFASILDFSQYAFKDIISRASSYDLSAHYFHKSSSAISIPLRVLDKFYKMTFCFVNFLFASPFPSCISWIVHICMISPKKKILQICDQWCNFGEKHKG